MKAGDLVFVYGTLRRGERADLSKMSGRSVDYLDMDFINGKLYHLGAFPGLKLLKATPVDFFDPEKPTVAGEVFLIHDSSVGAILDAYEGYRPDDPSHGHYDRAEVVTKRGRFVWVYVYNPLVTEDQWIETGDWKQPRLAATHRIPIITIGKKTR